MANILDGNRQLVVVPCGREKTTLAFLYLIVLEELRKNPRLPRYGIRVLDNPTVLFVGPLSDLSITQVR